MEQLTLRSRLTSGALLSIVSISSLAGTQGIVGTPTTTEACRTAVTGLIPLPDLGPDSYQGAEGGLYPSGSNIVPEAHLRTGLREADGVTPRDESGQPSAGGRVGFVSIGVSNTKTEFDAFIRLFADDPGVADHVVFVNGSQSGEDVDQWLEPNDETWTVVTHAVEQAGLSVDQVQAAWVKLPDKLPDRGEPKGEINFPATMLRYQEKLTIALGNAKLAFPNLRLVYLSSRIYGGFASGPQSEPLSYEQGFAVKWVIEDQIEGLDPANSDANDPSASLPWLAWGPYLWADGSTARADGLTWLCPDFESDHVHPSVQGAEKVARLLFDFLRADPTSSPWFNTSGVPTGPGSSPTPTVPALDTTPIDVSPTTAAAGPPAVNSGREGGVFEIIALVLVLSGVAALVSAVTISRKTANTSSG